MDNTTPTTSEGFTDLGERHDFTIYQDYAHQVSAKTADTGAYRGISYKPLAQVLLAPELTDDT